MRIDGLFKSSLFAVLLLGACSPYSLENESILECYPEKRIGTRSVSGQETPQYVFPSINKEVVFSSYSERVAFFQIPQDTVSLLSTSVLAGACLDYPLLMDAFAFNSLSEGIRTVLSRFNGFAEIITRKGARESLVSEIERRRSNQINIGLEGDEQSFEELRGLLWDEIIKLEEFALSASSPFGIEPSTIKRERSDLSRALYYLYTPNGSFVTDTYSLPELLTPECKLSKKNYWMNQNMGLIFVSEATTTYNCHFYAWSEKYPSELAWLGVDGTDLTDEDVYWEDGSYVETTESDPDARVVSYVNGDHSALVYHGDTLISKWGADCVFLHTKYNCPYNTSELKYYKKVPERPRVTGKTFPVTLNINGQYRDRSFKLVNYPPVTSSIQWEVGPNGQILSGQGTDSVCVRIFDSLFVSARVTTTYGRVVSFSTNQIRVYFAQPYIFSCQLFGEDVGLQNNRRMLVVKLNNAPRTVSWSLRKSDGSPVSYEACLEEAFLGQDASFSQPQLVTQDFVVSFPGDFLIEFIASGVYGDSIITIPVSVAGNPPYSFQYTWGTPVIQNAVCPPPPPYDIPISPPSS